MKRVLTSAVAAALLVAGTGSEAQSQEARISLFDLGIYGGGSWTSSWLNRPAADDVTPGFAPALGAHATFWTNPNLGIRTHVGYVPIDLPDEASHSGTNFWLYDLSVVARPWIGDVDRTPLMASTYFWLGAGGVTSNPAGRANTCVAPYQAEGACLHLQARRGTVGQGTAGVGVDVFSLTENLGVFGELGVHGYSSPFHTGPGWAPLAPGAQQANDPLAFTARFVLGAKLLMGDIAPVPVVVPPPAPPRPAPTPAPQPQTVQVCVIQDGQLRTVATQVNPTTGDTTIVVDGQTRRFRDVQPGTQAYAAGRTWFVQGDPIQVMNRRYVRFGLTRVIQPAELTQVGEFQGVPVFAPTGQTTAPDVIYLPVRPGCEFQPFQHEAEIQVRG